MRRTLITLAATIALLFGTALPAWAFEIEPIHIVHTERVRAGPYDITVGFSTWPLRAMQSLDFTFTPESDEAAELARAVFGQAESARLDAHRVQDRDQQIGV